MLKVQLLQEHEDWEDRDRQKVDTACMGVHMEHIQRERSHKGVVGVMAWPSFFKVRGVRVVYQKAEGGLRAHCCLLLAV